MLLLKSKHCLYMRKASRVSDANNHISLSSLKYRRVRQTKEHFWTQNKLGDIADNYSRIQINR